MRQVTRIAYNFIPGTNEDETIIDIYDAIANKQSYDWWSDKNGTEVTPKDFEEKLKAVTTKNIVIRMNSGGGEVTAANVIAVAIEEAIKNDGKNIVCKIVGMCASAAVQIAIACSEVIIHEGALMMIHNPLAGICGFFDSRDLQKVDNMLTAVKNTILNHYEKKTGLTRQKLSNLMDAETYMDGREAVDKGFADKLMFDEEEKTEDVIDRIHSVVNYNGLLNVPEKYRGVVANTIPKTNKTEGEPKEMEIKTVNELTAQFPDLVNQIREDAIAGAREAAVNEGVAQERARLQSIDEMAGKVSDELLQKAKYETFDTAQNVAMEAIKTGAFNNTPGVTAMAQESQNANQVPGVVNGVTPTVVDEKKQATDNAESVAKAYFAKIGKGGN